LQGTPMRIQYKSSKNPFEGSKPKPLTEAEQRRAHRARIRGRKLYGWNYRNSWRQFCLITTNGNVVLMGEAKFNWAYSCSRNITAQIGPYRHIKRSNSGKISAFPIFGCVNSCYLEIVPNCGIFFIKNNGIWVACYVLLNEDTQSDI